MFYKHFGVQYHEQAICEGETPEQIAFCMTKTFKILFLSSNNGDFYKAKNGYVLCRNESGYNLKPSNVSFQTNTKPIGFQSTELYLR